MAAKFSTGVAACTGSAIRLLVAEGRREPVAIAAKSQVGVGNRNFKRMTGHVPPLFLQDHLHEIADVKFILGNAELFGFELRRLQKARAEKAQFACFIFNQRQQLLLRRVEFAHFAQAGSCSLNRSQRRLDGVSQRIKHCSPSRSLRCAASTWLSFSKTTQRSSVTTVREARASTTSGPRSSYGYCADGISAGAQEPSRGMSHAIFVVCLRQITFLCQFLFAIRPGSRHIAGARIGIEDRHPFGGEDALDQVRQPAGRAAGAG